MFQRILLPLDGSELAECAAPCAARLAGSLGGVLHVVRVVEPPVKPGFTTQRLYKEMLEAEREEAVAYVDAMRKQLATCTASAKTDVLCGNAAVALLDYEHYAGIELVVMCSHGRGGLARFAGGSVADRLLHHGSVPLLLVRAFGAPPALAKAIVPLDGSSRAEETLLALEQLVPYVVNEVTLLRVVHGPDQASEAHSYLVEAAQSIPSVGVVCRCRVEQGDPAHVICDVAGENTLVVMATHGRGGLARWALGSVADRVTRHGRSAVLLVRAATAHETLQSGIEQLVAPEKHALRRRAGSSSPTRRAL